MEKKKFGGRRKGSVNHFTRSVRQVMADTFNEMQLLPDVNLLDWAKENPTEFYKLSAKLIPEQVETYDNTPRVTIQLIPDEGCYPIGTNPEDVINRRN